MVTTLACRGEANVMMCFSLCLCWLRDAQHFMFHVRVAQFDTVMGAFGGEFGDLSLTLAVLPMR